MMDSRRVKITIAFGSLCGLVLLDETILSVALPSIREEFQLSTSATHWIVNAYMLAFTCLAAVGGKLMNIFGLKPTLFVAGLVFAAASMAAGFSQDAAMLLTMRTLQGICAAVFYPLSFAGVVSIFPAEQHGKAIGFLASVATVFLACGPVVGGAIANYLDWRWIFWINIPVVVLTTVVICATWKKLDHENGPKNVDGVGLVFMLIGMLGLIFGLMEGADYGWSNPMILVCLVLGSAALLFFWRFEGSHPDPLIDVGLFNTKRFAACEISILVGQFSKMTVALYVPLYLVDELKVSPMLAGFSVLCAVGPFPILSPLTGKIADKYGSGVPIVFGTFFLSLATIAIGASMYFESFRMLLLALVFWGVAIPFAFIVPSRLTTISVPVQKQGELSGLTTTMRLIGSTLGVTAGSVFLRSGSGFSTVFWLSGALFLATSIFCVWALKKSPHLPDQIRATQNR